MPRTSDRRLLRLEAQLGTSIQFMRRTVAEAEALRDQMLSDDLHENLQQLERIHAELVMHGHRYKPQSAPVRI